MNFVSLSFALFLAVVLMGWCLSHNHPRVRVTVLLVANLAFYAAGGLAFLPLLVGVAILNWGIARLMARTTEGGVTEDSASLGLAVRKRWLLLGLVCNLGILAGFKYYEFFVLQLASVASIFDLSLPLSTLLPPFMADMAFPVGISFYIFQGIAYIVEQHRHPEAQPQPYLHVLLFLSFFPTVLAGPIMRPVQFFPQLAGSLASRKMPGESDLPEASPPVVAGEADTLTVIGNPSVESFHTDNASIQEGFALILSGLFKKVVLASFLSEQVVRDAFQGPEGFSSLALLIAAYGYSIQIFCDFSGYTDLAMGVGRLLGFSLPQNFAAPYLSLNLQEFWRRWHITLSSWLRDYLYIPLGGSKKGNRYFNLFATMVLGGLWHGAHARFLVWGALHGAGLVVVHAVHAIFPPPATASSEALLEEKSSFSFPRFVGKGLAWIATFNFVTLAWIFFRAEDMPRALEIIKRILFWGQPGEGIVFAALPAIACGFAVQLLGPSLFKSFIRIQTALPLPAQALLAALAGGLILRMGPDGVLPFIYFQF